MNNKVPIFYYNKKLIIKEICDRMKDIALILKKQKDEIEIRRLRKSLKNYSNNYENK